jgi:SAM-dependent methyltransferase
MESDPLFRPPDMLAYPRSGLIDANIIHEFKLSRVVQNLDGCYGELMRKRYREMLSWIKGTRIIDCGCGFGQFSRVALTAGFHVTAIEIDEASIALARTYSGIPCYKESVYQTSLPDGACDTAVCCDSVQHFNIQYFAHEMERLGVKRIVIYDSNIENPLLMMYRVLADHKESNDRTPQEIVRQFEEYNYRSVRLEYENIIALPVSGGFQRRPVPLLHRFPRALRAIDHALVKFIRACGLERRFSFRFFLVLDRA